ncbi:MAG: hypothetical protein KAW19_06130 [Candidatus Aminicenantes bacterium]|nr:hypothetical protein [Candidatus Aminicenantes bacterium]
MYENKSITLVLPPECQRIWLLDPFYLWIHHQPTIILMEENDYRDSQSRARNSVYDFAVYQGLKRLKYSGLLWFYRTQSVLRAKDTKDLEEESLRIVKTLGFGRSESSAISLGYHVWQEYVRYLEAKDPFFPFWGDDRFYRQVYSAFNEDKAETKSHLTSFQLGKVPTTTDVEFIMTRLIKKTLLALNLTMMFRRKGFRNAFFYNTWEYKPIIDIVCNFCGLDPIEWVRLQGDDLTDPWKCLEDAFETLDARKYGDRGIFHFVKKTSEAFILQQATQEVKRAWIIHEGNASIVRKKLVQGIQQSLDILSSSRASHYFSHLKTVYGDTSGLIGAPSLPFGYVSQLIQRVELWRVKNRIPAYAYLFLLKSGSSLLDLPNLRPPFGPLRAEKQDEALRLVEKSRWLKWKEVESMALKIGDIG